MVAIAVFTALLLNADSSWVTLSNADGLTLERRPVKDSAYYEYRVTTDTDVSVNMLCDGVFDWGTVTRAHELIKARQLLSDEKDVRVVYDQIVTPAAIAPRDVAYEVRREHLPDGVCRVDANACDDARAPALQKGWVRMPKLRSRWVFEPQAAGTHVTYTIFSDPGGALPAGIVHGSQRDAALSTVRKGIKVSREAAVGALRN